MLTHCVECGAEFDIGEPELDELLTCPECDLEMVVVSVRPLELEAFSEDMDEEADAQEEDEDSWEQ